MNHSEATLIGLSPKQSLRNSSFPPAPLSWLQNLFSWVTKTAILVELWCFEPNRYVDMHKSLSETLLCPPSPYILLQTHLFSNFFTFSFLVISSTPTGELYYVVVRVKNFKSQLRGITLVMLIFAWRIIVGFWYQCWLWDCISLCSVHEKWIINHGGFKGHTAEVPVVLDVLSYGQNLGG